MVVFTNNQDESNALAPTSEEGTLIYQINTGTTWIVRRGRLLALAVPNDILNNRRDITELQRRLQAAENAITSPGGEFVHSQVRTITDDTTEFNFRNTIEHPYPQFQNATSEVKYFQSVQYGEIIDGSIQPNEVDTIYHTHIGPIRILIT